MCQVQQAESDAAGVADDRDSDGAPTWVPASYAEGILHGAQEAIIRRLDRRAVDVEKAYTTGVLPALDALRKWFEDEFVADEDDARVRECRRLVALLVDACEDLIGSTGPLTAHDVFDHLRAARIDIRLEALPFDELLDEAHGSDAPPEEQP